MVNYTPETRGMKKDPSTTDVLAKDIMQKSFIHLQESLVTAEAAKLLLDYKLPGAPVVNESGQLVGFLSEKDCLHRVIKSRYLNTPSIPISEYMSTELVTVSPEDNLFYVVELFTRHPYHCYPVVENNRCVGLIYRHNCLKATMDTYRRGFA